MRALAHPCLHACLHRRIGAQCAARASRACVHGDTGLRARPVGQSLRYQAHGSARAFAGWCLSVVPTRGRARAHAARSSLSAEAQTACP
eukprot:6116890-Alexandrium_andersonii.AAC.1